MLSFFFLHAIVFDIEEEHSVQTASSLMMQSFDNNFYYSFIYFCFVSLEIYTIHGVLLRCYMCAASTGDILLTL